MHRHGSNEITHSNGASAYIGDQHYVVASFAFTPTGGTADTATLGNKAGLSGAVTCTQQQEGGTLPVVLLPVPLGPEPANLLRVSRSSIETSSSTRRPGGGRSSSAVT